MASSASSYTLPSEGTPLDDMVNGSAANNADTGSNDNLVPSEVKKNSKPLGYIGGKPYFGNFSKQFLSDRYGSAQSSFTDRIERRSFTSFASDIEVKKQTPEELRVKEQEAILSKITNPIEKEAIRAIMIESNLAVVAFKEGLEKNTEQLQAAKIAQETWLQYVQKKTMLEELSISRNGGMSMGR